MKEVDTENKFLEIIRQHERLIYKVCTFYVSKDYSLEDLYQEIICNLWSSFPKFRHECSESIWIYRIALNTCISRIRKNKHRIRNDVPLHILHESVAEPENTEGQIKEMYQLIYFLKTIEKAVILLYLEEKSYQEIADITGISVSNVATKLKRTKEKLRKMSNN